MNRILFALGSSTYPFVTGGMEVFNYYLINALQDSLDIAYLATHKMDIRNATHKKSYNIRPTKYLFPLQLFLNLLFSKKYDKVVFSFSAAHAVIWDLYNKICRILGIKYIVVIHYGDVTPSKNDRIYQRFFKDAETVVAVSEDIKKNYDAKYGTDCKVIFPLVPFTESQFSKNELRKKYNVPQDANTICMVGSIKGMKNPDTIIEALHSFTKEEMEKYKPHVVFAGSGTDLEILKEKTAQCNLSKHITFLGNVPKETVNEIYKLSDLYLIASDFEGTSVSLLEAMFNKMPIITSRAPGIVNTIEEDTECLMFATKDASRLKECILKYLDNPDMPKQYASQAFKHFNRAYNYEDVVKAYVQILNN